MKLRSIPFDTLPFSDLFCSYIRQPDNLKSFYQVNPFDDEKVKRRAGQFRFKGERELSADALEHFNGLFDAPESTFRQIGRLKESDALAVVTGQQLTLYGGPLFTIYKTITAIIYAKRWEKLLNRPVIPVFWLADEDHDFEEAGEIGLLGDDVRHCLELENGSAGPVGREVFGETYSAFEKELFDLLPESDFTTNLKSDIQNFYKTGSTFREAFARWLLHLFGKYGLVLAGSDDPAIKKLTAGPMLIAAEKHKDFYRSLESQSLQLEREGYVRQALVQDSNIFYLDPDYGRRKLVLQDGRWGTGNGRFWSGDELAAAIRNDPASFSPNVFLRPLMQDLLIPAIAYVPGPGELAYYAQMKRAYQVSGQEMPMLVPRFSLTLKEPAIERISKELPFEFHEYFGRAEDLEALYLKRTNRYQVEQIFSSWISSSNEVTEEKRKQIMEIDPALGPSAGKAAAVFRKELEKLKKKTYRSVKQKEKIQLGRIRRIRENLFPDGHLQERQVAFIFYMNKYGPDLWDRLIDTLADEIPDSHKIVYL